MAKTKRNYDRTDPVPVVPEDISQSTFYELRLDKDQLVFRDAIWNPKNLAVICNSKAGTGKTLIAVATASMLVASKRYNDVYYIVSAAVDDRQGFLPGTLAEKSQYYYTPLYQAVLKIGQNPLAVIKTDSLINQKSGEAYITCMTDTYLRGCTLSKSVVIIDEAQNFTVDQLRTAITRIPDDSKVIVIGHDKQCDLRGKQSGFQRVIEHFAIPDWAQVCTLTQNHRGVLSAWADEL